MSKTVNKLPFDKSALEPYMSSNTISYHYDRHHKGYAKKLEKLVKGTDYEGLSLEEMIVRARKEAQIDILNNAAQVWNHNFFWKSLSPNGGKPNGRIKNLVEVSFKNFGDFENEFRSAATGLFGSGWVWLVLDRGKIRITTSSNADSPVGTDLVPLLTLDVWEHAYYLDYQNERAGFVDAFLDKLVNWDFAAANLESEAAGRAA
ncbi:MAG: superoxide dismutase [Gammaproteobacteria bacterium]|nr:superoxide dismutase [Gammaproteobacteria bacterium]MBT8109657.1 superoxide dismutase [Gammaproteobacteria bacterium]NND46477.1 superoxide dismutase [Woeseiaceae bacterium]NNL44361.1 superoxide dismutase [Woeseiaceae bacterium]